MKRFVYVILAVTMGCLWTMASAQSVSPDTQGVGGSVQNHKVGVVLGGGGAKGAAHIGVLKYMEEIGIPVSYVTGTSMGSIVGGLYAMGYSADELVEIISGIDWPIYITGKVERRYLSQRKRSMKDRLLLNVPFGNYMRDDEDEMAALPTGAVAGDNLVNLFSCLSTGYQDSMSFDSMPIPFACVATDLMTGHPMVLRDGEFARALRSSMAIPIFFTPVETGKKLLADGGITNNFPVDVCIDMGADVIIGLEVASELADNPDDLHSITRQLQQYLSIVTNRDREEHRDRCNIYINPDVSGINMMSFNSEAIAELVRRGYEAAKAHEAEFMLLKESLGSGQTLTRRKVSAYPLLAPDTVVFDAISFSGMNAVETRFLKKAMQVIVGVPVTIDMVENIVRMLQGSGRYQCVYYKVCPIKSGDGSDYGHYELIFEVTPELPCRMGVGLRYDSEESATLLLHTSWNSLKMSGLNASVNIALNYNLRADVHAGWIYPAVGDIGFDALYHQARFYCYNNPTAAQDLYGQQLRLGITTIQIPQLELMFGILRDYNYRRANSQSSDTNVIRSFASGVYLNMHMDTKDEPYYATRGLLLNFGGNLRYPDGLKPIKPISDVSLNVKGYISASDRLTFIPALYGRVMFGYDGHELWYNNVAGGNMAGRYLNHQMPFVGMLSTIELGPAALLYSVEARYRILKKSYVSLQADLMSSSSRSELAGLFSNGYSATHYVGVGTAVGYSSVIGPITLHVGWNSYQHAVHGYLNIGFEL